LAKIEDVLGGSIGYFWPFDRPKDLQREPLRGHVCLRDQRWLTLDALDERDLDDLSRAERNEQMPAAVAGVTRATGVLLLNCQSRGSKRNFGGSRASTEHYRFRTIASGVVLQHLQSERIQAVSAHFSEALPWAGLEATQTSFEKHEGSNKLRSASISLTSSPKVTVRTVGGIYLTLAPYWSMDGPDDRRVIQSLLSVETKGPRPLPFDQLARPIHGVRVLLSVCHGREFPCVSGTATPHYAADIDVPRTELWDMWLMESHEPVTPPRISKEPRHALVTLVDLGGIEGLRRWLKLIDQHGRFLGPLIHRSRMQLASVEVRMLELYAAIEYFVNDNRRQRNSWATDAPHVAALAKRASAKFRDWVGDYRKWAEAVRQANNQIKHDPSPTDPEHIQALAISAEVLITCVALDISSASKRASVRYLGDYRVEQWGRRVRSALGA